MVDPYSCDNKAISAPAKVELGLRLSLAINKSYQRPSSYILQIPDMSRYELTRPVLTQRALTKHIIYLQTLKMIE